MKHRVFVSFASLFLILASTGCVSAKYKKADEDTPPPVRLDFKGSQPKAEATVHSVIVFQGPGSWKRNAYWDEYVVSLVNRGDTPLSVDSAALIDFHAESAAPGADPWSLEKQSLSFRNQVNRAAKATLVQIGSGLAVASVGGAIAAASLVSATTAAAGTWAVGIAGAALLPVYIGGAIYRNVSSRHDIEAEFARRRLMLPTTVAPGQTVQGSLFFRISPGPQRLELRTRADQATQTLIVDLKPLASLHLAGPAAPVTPPANASTPPATP